MYSYTWRFINSFRGDRPKRAAYLGLITGSTIFSFPRFQEGWFYFSIVAYPLSLVVAIEAIRYISPQITRIQLLGNRLLLKEADKRLLRRWWKSNTLNKRHLMLSLLGATLLAFSSLYFNANPRWSKYTDAVAVFYLGFIVSEIVYLLTLIPSWLWKLSRHRLRLNPIDPANTGLLRSLSQAVFCLAINSGAALLVFNLVIAVSSFLFPHLRSGIIIVSIAAWISVILSAGLPHLMFAQIVEEGKQETLNSLQEMLMLRYDRFLSSSDAVSYSAIEEIMKTHKSVLESNSFPISGTSYIGIGLTLVFNSVSAIIALMK